MTAGSNHVPDSAAPDGIEMPAPTVWPMILAFGLALGALGLLSDLAISGVGAILFLGALAGWIGQLVPGAGWRWEAFVPPGERARPVREAAPVPRPAAAAGRSQVPEKIHPYSAGARGGVLGGIAMAVLALIYGLVSRHGIWYPINLLAGTVLPLPQAAGGGPDLAHLEHFHLGWLLLATVIHGVASVGLGVLYGVLLPTLPGRPIIWGGIVAPLLWTGAVYGFMGVLNPLLSDRVDWPWFIASQFAYGLTVGVVVLRSEKVHAGPPVRRGGTVEDSNAS